MKMTFRFGLRNLFRYAGRTSVCSAMTIAGFIAIVLFRGFSGFIIEEMIRISTRMQFTHIQVANQNSFEGLPVDHGNDRLIRDSIGVEQQLRTVPGVESIVPRLTFFGLLSGGKSSIAAQAIGIDTQLESHIMQELTYHDGTSIPPGDNNSILVAQGLAKKIQVKAGDDLTIIANTVDGAINAVDVRAAGIISTSIKEFDEWTFYIPIQTAQRLLDTDLVERFGIYVKNPDNYNNVSAQVRSVVGQDLQVKTWRDLASLFVQTESFFKTQNLFLAIIIFSLVFLSIMNIIGQSIVERTGEIGTMRAIGESRPLILKFNFILSAYSEAALLSIATALLATFMAARRGANMNITDALRKNLE